MAYQMTVTLTDDEYSTLKQDYLARLFGQGKSASEMVIEDRGPY